MKKIFIGVILLVFIMGRNSYAVEVSIGLSGQYIGVSVLRGDDAGKFLSGLKYRGLDDVSIVSFFPGFQVDMMIEFSPFLALETGIGYSTSAIKIEGESYYNKGSSCNRNSEVVLERKEISIPFMLRLQVESRRQVFYVSGGVKLGIPTTTTYASVSGSKFLEKLSSGFGNSDFAMDASFALGSESRLIGAHYLGTRIGYDLSVIDPFDGEGMDDFFHDDFYASITYRYAFNSKWNKPKNTTQKLDPNVL